MEVVDLLIQLAPREALKKGADGHRRYASVHRQAVAAGVLPSRSVDEVQALHGVFDLAVEHGYGAWVLDYVEEVCSDAYCTSNDPVEAYLLDGECVLVSACTAAGPGADGARGWAERCELRAPVAHVWPGRGWIPRARHCARATRRPFAAPSPPPRRLRRRHLAAATSPPPHPTPHACRAGAPPRCPACGKPCARR
jgi:hypothetical protein